jgi:hypothetical protein
MTAKKKVNVPALIAGQLIYKSDSRCCICQKKGDHIHHLDGVPSNNNLDNLAFLCFHHHDLASIKGGLSRKLAKETIIEYRKHHYEVIENRRKRELNALDNPITRMTEEKLLTITKTALIILELENVKSKYFSAEWIEKSRVLDELDKYVNHTNNRIAYDILDFLSLVATHTRSGMPESLASSLLRHIQSFCPSLRDVKERKQSIDLAKMCIHIGDNIAYDSFIHLRKITIAMYGLTIIKLIYRKAKEYDIPVLKKEVEQSYKDLKSNLQRPERNDLNDAQEMLKIFHDDLENGDLSFPMLSESLMNRLENERRMT